MQPIYLAFFIARQGNQGQPDTSPYLGAKYHAGIRPGQVHGRDKCTTL